MVNVLKFSTVQKFVTKTFGPHCSSKIGPNSGLTGM